MIWKKILGQDKAIDVLRQSAAAGRLAHALLFVGPAGVGKSLVARALATCLFCERFLESQLEACGECGSCRMMAAGVHPDFLRVSRPEDKSELPIDLLVGRLENRGREGLCYDLSLRPMSAPRRVAVIEDADFLSTDGANSLLKTLEEPPSYAVIVLIAADAAGLLPTIRSRCQTLRFAPLAAECVARLAIDLGWTESADEATAAAALAEGSLQVAQQILDPQLRDLRLALLAGLSSEAVRATSMVRIALERLETIGGDTQRQRQNARWIVRFLVEFFQAALREWSGVLDAAGSTLGVPRFVESAALIRQWPAADPAAAESIGDAIDRCIDAELQLDGNVSVPLCLECLFGDLATILQPALRL